MLFFSSFFFFNDTATTEIYTLSLHDALPIFNLNRVKSDVIRSGRAFLVEGYTDVIALDQAGIPEAVATCGTARSEEHTSELQSPCNLVCRLLLEKKKQKICR